MHTDQKELDNKYCVYMHISPSNKKYIGITKQRPTDRWSNGNGYKHSPFFHNAITKYGWNNFKHIILFDKLSEERALRLETLCIILLRTNNKLYGYNLTTGGEHPIFPEDYITHNSKAVYCYEEDKEFSSIAEAQRYFNLSTYTGILQNCEHIQNSCHNKHFCFIEEKEQLIQKLKNKKNTDDKRIYCFNNKTIYSGTYEAAKETGAALRTIQRRCIDNNRKPTPNGYIFAYLYNLEEVE